MTEKQKHARSNPSTLTAAQEPSYCKALNSIFTDRMVGKGSPLSTRVKEEDEAKNSEIKAVINVLIFALIALIALYLFNETTNTR